MKAFSAVLALAVVALLFVLFRQQLTLNQLQSELLASGLDRSELRAQFQRQRNQIEFLHQAVSDSAAKERAAKTAPAAPVQAALAAEPVVPVARPGVSISAPAGW